MMMMIIIQTNKSNKITKENSDDTSGDESNSSCKEVSVLPHHMTQVHQVVCFILISLITSPLGGWHRKRQQH
jgi:hypothetical protein